MTSRLSEMGYDSSDIHHFHVFFCIDSVIVKDPDGNKEEDRRRERGARLALRLLNGKDRMFIDQAITYGATGLDYTQITFKIPSDEQEE